ncbi:MAG: acyl carrier protein [Hyphomonadaceae bacterium]
MTEDDIIAVIREAVREETDNSAAEVVATTTSSEIAGWDSLAHVRIVINVESRLGTAIEIAETYSARNVGELAELILKAMAR